MERAGVGWGMLVVGWGKEGCREVERVVSGVWVCDTSCMDRLCCWERERGCWVYGWLSGAAAGGGVGRWVVGEEADAVGWLRREFIRVGVGKQGGEWGM
jgi:hypothetical protein